MSSSNYNTNHVRYVPPQSQQQQYPQLQSNNNMTSNSGMMVSSSTVGPRAKCDQVIYEAICKACEIIVGSRCSIVSSSSSTTTTNHTSSCRFNLQIPEVSTVRSILGQYRVQLHVPIRLDVYYQHHNHNHRELLERYCIEYISVPSEQFLQIEGMITNDPMVQLTHVCKRIVVWLRTLYCSIRLLPSQQMISNIMMIQQQQNQHYDHNTQQQQQQQIGFSIYANTDYTNHDISELIAHHGFVQEQQQQLTSSSRNSNSQHHIVTTPYGQLSWQVIYCPISKLQHMIIPNSMKSTNNTTTVVRIQTPKQQQEQQEKETSRSRPIPISKYQHHHTNNTTTTNEFAPHSAPTIHRPPPTYTERSHQRRMEVEQQLQQQSQIQPQQLQQPIRPMGKSYEPHRHLYKKSMTTTGMDDIQSQQHQHHPISVQRSHSTIGNQKSPIKLQKKPVIPSKDQPPERVMSGLSLALLMANNDDTNDMNKNPRKMNHNEDHSMVPTSSMNDKNMDHDDTDDSNVRRAALHHLPPHLLLEPSPIGSPSGTTRIGSIQDSTTTTTTTQPLSVGDYGYGYNNHIPWQKIHPSNSNPAFEQPHHPLVSNNNHNNSFGRTLSSSPSSIYPMSPIQHQQSNFGQVLPSGSSGGSVPTTPPGAFYRSTPPTTGGITTTTNHHHNTNFGLGQYIPPRKQHNENHTNSTITPPFPSRPVGFLHEPPTLFLDSQHPSASSATTTTTSYATSSRMPPDHEIHRHKNATTDTSKTIPVTSLDSLRSSPFHHQQQLSLYPDHRSTMISSSSLAGGGGGLPGSDYMSAQMSLAPSIGGPMSDVFRRSLWSGSSSAAIPSSMANIAGLDHNILFDHHHYNNNNDEYGEEMPFAMEIPISSTMDGSISTQQQQQTQSSVKSGVFGSSTGKSIGASTTFGNSSSLATLVQKCSIPNQRLKMFGTISSSSHHDNYNNNTSENQIKTTHNDNNDITNDLAEQLQEFRMFGESLHPSLHSDVDNNIARIHHDEQHGLTGSGTSSTSTPISLRS